MKEGESMFDEFMQAYGMELLSTVVLGVAAYVGTILKNLYKKWVDDETKAKVARTVVKAVEQLYSDLNGQEKYEKAVENVAQMLQDKGICNCSELEVQMLIEAAVTELKVNVKGE